MRKDSIAFGAEAGLSIPIHGPHNNFATLLLVQMQNERCNGTKAMPNMNFWCCPPLLSYIQSHLLNAVTAKESF